MTTEHKRPQRRPKKLLRGHHSNVDKRQSLTSTTDHKTTTRPSAQHSDNDSFDLPPMAAVLTSEIAYSMHAKPSSQKNDEFVDAGAL